MSITCRHLVVVLGDQLDPESSAFDGFDAGRDRVWMAEVAAESTHVWSHRARIAVFLSAMRHFRDRLRDLGRQVEYLALDAHPFADLAEALTAAIDTLAPERIVMTEPGDHRVREDLRAACHRAGIPLELRPDRHFINPLGDFESWLSGRKQPRLEHFYRHLRQRTGILMDAGEPVGGRWNFDAENRKAFGRQGPGLLPAPRAFEPDAITAGVIELVNTRFADHPGSLQRFDWPVTREQALAALDDFVAHRLAAFGPFQDALWAGEPWLYHSRLACALNLKLLSPREAIDAAVDAFERGDAPLASVEGFVRQILGWREYVRGLYWHHMPDYLEANALGAEQPLPALYWSGETGMRCLAECVGQTLEYGYAHHIQRLMVTGLFALLAAVRPRALHEWYLAVYVDAVEWVELPNTIGMSQYADGGWMASKPYVASGKYIQRMSNYCDHCRFKPGQRTGEDACPYTTFYWDFLIRHQGRFASHPRTALQWRNLERIEPAERGGIRRRAESLRERLADAAL